MPIEITSVSEAKFLFTGGPLLAIRRAFQAIPRTQNRQHLLLRFLFGVLAISTIAAADSVLNSYKYYSRIIDARLASGYLTSRPGLYAAPRVLQPGQKLSHADLISQLRRAGYVESEESVVWNGSFREREGAVEIKPQRASDSSTVRVDFDKSDQRIAALTRDSHLINSFTLEPETLSNDLSVKMGEHETLSYSELPPVLVHAILAIEDRRFFQHTGVDIIGIVRAVLRNAGDDHVGQGGSTITQQLVKNTYLSPERTLRRKYAEAMLSIALERRLSKEDIFALYCNEIYLGQRGAVAARGVKEAARIYFAKDVSRLSLAEAATIAGMIQSPARYSPIRHEDAAKARRADVLNAMLRDGWIDAAQAARAGNESLAVTTNISFKDAIAPYFIDSVEREVEPQSDSPAANRVYTTIDLDLQQLAEASIKHQLGLLDAVYKNRSSKPQAALVALDPHTGNVLAMVGGRDYAESQLNRAVDARRQPGSTFKPFVYAAALEDGMSPVQTFSDSPREFVYDHSQIYRPANFGGGYSMSDVTMRTGLVKSLNVVTVDVAIQTGLARIANLAAGFGLPKPERYPSLALGTKEVTPLELAAAYAAFANGGRRVYPRMIESLGESPAAHKTAAGDPRSQVIKPTTAYMITNMLTAVVDHGTARAARNRVKGTAVAGKTGTSRDGWFVGYTPNLVCVVWIGFDDNEQLGLTGAEAALPAWVDFVKEAVELRPELGGRNFDCPEGIQFVEIDAETGLLATVACPHREVIAVTERLAPNLECLRHAELPSSIDIRASERAADSTANESVLAQHARATNHTSNENGIGLTRVDVDERGRRTLLNALR